LTGITVGKRSINSSFDGSGELVETILHHDLTDRVQSWVRVGVVGSVVIRDIRPRDLDIEAVGRTISTWGGGDAEIGQGSEETTAILNVLVLITPTRNDFTEEISDVISRSAIESSGDGGINNTDDTTNKTLGTTHGGISAISAKANLVVSASRSADRARIDAGHAASRIVVNRLGFLASGASRGRTTTSDNISRVAKTLRTNTAWAASVSGADRNFSRTANDSEVLEASLKTGNSALTLSVGLLNRWGRRKLAVHTAISLVELRLCSLSASGKAIIHVSASELGIGVANRGRRNAAVNTASGNTSSSINSTSRVGAGRTEWKGGPSSFASLKLGSSAWVDVDGRTAAEACSGGIKLRLNVGRANGKILGFDGADRANPASRSARAGNTHGNGLVLAVRSSSDAVLHHLFGTANQVASEFVGAANVVTRGARILLCTVLRGDATQVE
jgi:hypothetical protein